MLAQTQEQLIHLYEKAAYEQDSDRLMDVVRDITRLLDEEEKSRVTLRVSSSQGSNG